MIAKSIEPTDRRPLYAALTLIVLGGVMLGGLLTVGHLARNLDRAEAFYTAPPCMANASAKQECRETIQVSVIHGIGRNGLTFISPAAEGGYPTEYIQASRNTLTNFAGLRYTGATVWHGRLVSVQGKQSSYMFANNPLIAMENEMVAAFLATAAISCGIVLALNWCYRRTAGAMQLIFSLGLPAITLIVLLLLRRNNTEPTLRYLVVGTMQIVATVSTSGFTFLQSRDAQAG